MKLTLGERRATQDDRRVAVKGFGHAARAGDTGFCAAAQASASNAPAVMQ
jgi:hypothetical protein